MTESVVLEVKPLGFPWETADPFLFCVYHDDAYPIGNENMGPAASLAGRDLGQDFAGKDGWRMYHGSTVPGFPSHPHRGFETVTIVRRGLIDHSDSLGATARFGAGDVQWLTAGRGIVHAEMFPLVDRAKPNPLELFQIWLNLPAKNKMVEPHFRMLWSEDIPRQTFDDAQGRSTELVSIAGRVGDLAPPAPPPKSWAAQPESDLAIVTLRMTPGAHFTLPAARGARTRRRLYFFRGKALTVAGRSVPVGSMIEVRVEQDVDLAAGPETAEILMLQGEPIDEPVAQYGPFVMNTQAEIQQAFLDYRKTEFGGWPWPRNDPVHPRDQRRFAKHVDGRTEER
jgi:redox-sensitive bicupin YhaK (pirin superfamily)